MNQTVSTDVLVNELSFFDQEATGLGSAELAIPTATDIERYRTAVPSPGNAVKDALFAALQPLAGKRILDYGCGTGENSCLLAACGAQVSAFDLSPQSVAQARRRAAVHGLSDRIHFAVAAAGQVPYPPQSFDLVVGSNVLHHLHHDLPRIYAEIARLLTPSGSAYFIEPVANSAALRTLRKWLPIPNDKTPDERQLLYQDFDGLQPHFSQVELAHFYLLDRVHRFGLGRSRLVRRIDHYAQRLVPLLRRYYGMVLVIARH
jgi:SAM-dependent methyltransferase